MSSAPEPALAAPCGPNDLQTAFDAQSRAIAVLRRSLAIAESRLAEARTMVSAKEADLAAFLEWIVAQEEGSAPDKPLSLLTSSEFEALLRDRSRLAALRRSRWWRLGERLGVVARAPEEAEHPAEPSPDDLRRRTTGRIGDIAAARRELAGPPSGLPDRTPERGISDSLRRFHAECRDHGVDVVVDLGGDGDDGRFVPALRGNGYSGEAVSFPPRSAGRDTFAAAADDPLWRVEDGGSRPPGESLRSLYPDPSVAFGVRIGAVDGGVVPLLADVLERAAVILAPLPFGPGAAAPSGGAGDVLRARGFLCIALFPASADPATRELVRVDGLFVRGTPA